MKYANCWKNMSAALVGATLLMGGAGWAQEEKELFRISNAVIESGRFLDPIVLRRRFVELKFDPTVQPNSLEGSRAPATSLALNLFEDVSLEATFDRVESYQEGALTWIGRVNGEADSSVILVSVGDVMAGSIRSGDALYQIRYAGNGAHVVYEVDFTELPDELEPLSIDGNEANDAPSGDSSLASAESVVPALDLDTAADDGSQIDVAVFYTPAARVAEGGTAAIRALINLGIAETNQAYDTSGALQDVRLAYTGQITYTESGSMSTDLSRLRGTSDGSMDAVHGIRNTYGADVVHLITNSGGGCGIAYVMETVSSSFASWAFGVTKRTCVSPNYSFAHELGHNMGLNHDRYVNTSNAPYPYCHGYVNQAALVSGAPASKRWRTIMAYNSECSDNGISCTRLKRFSNPYQFIGGDRVGVLGSSASSSTNGPADARRCLNNTRTTVANFRQTAFRPERVVTLSPNGLVPDRTPRYYWRPASDATSYRLWVNGPSGNVINQVITAAAASCSNGISLCRFTPTTSLAKADHTFWVQARNANGPGPWSLPRNFTVGMARPTLLGPSGTTFDRTPLYRWTRVPGATWYRLWVNGPSGNVIQQWFTATSVCSGSTCQVSPSTTLDSGTHTFWVQGWNSSILHGPWSAPMSFNVFVLIPIPLPFEGN